MQGFRYVAAAALGALLLAAPTAAGASAQERDSDDSGRLVFVQSDDPSGNQILEYRRAQDGALTLRATVPTGGLGGRLNGAGSDPLASQGSLQLDREHQLLIGVNAGSDTVYTFKLDGDDVRDRHVIGSGGSFPVSIAVHHDLVYVLNARGAGSVHGYRIDDGRLESIPGSTRSLNLTPNSTATEFLTTPGQVGFSPDGRQLIVTTKNNGSHIDVFNVGRDGLLSAAPVVNASSAPVPFAFTFNARDELVVGEAGTSSLSTYRLHADGSLTPIASASDGQVALCWITFARGTYFVSNTGSADVSGFRVDASGHPTLVGSTPVGPGPIDSARSGRFLYVQLGGNGALAELAVNADGTLSPIGSVPSHAGQEGIVAL